MNNQTFLQEAQALSDEIISNRRHLHRNPELSFYEYNTSAYIQNKLSEMGITSTVMATTGVIAEIGHGERCVALRADIDALPIEEETGLEFASLNKGVMHACGHDAHTSMLLGAAKILKNHEHELSGIVKLIFQPGEEKVPGGASILIKEGVLTNPAPEVIFGQHVFPGNPVGESSFVAGSMMASADELYWTIRGKGCHAAQPHQGIDPILVAAELIMHLQSIITKIRNPLAPGVLAITSIHGGTVTNIVPDTVELKGTLRSFDNEWRYLALAEIKKRSEMIAEMHGAICEFNPLIGYPPLVNNQVAVNFARKTAESIFGEETVSDFEPKMWGEDFSFYAQEIPACFWVMGVRPLELDEMPGLHNAHFTPDEDALASGTALLVSVATEWLKNPNPFLDNGKS
ncbi:MAG: amidohydrolase [Ignavibacteriae bacterium]|nr:amidohydrolase [Ignavibacteriota bacterium]